jgi:MFS family permease
MLESPLALIRRLPAPVRLLVVGTLINKLGSFIVPYLSLVLNREFHMSAAAAGGLITAYAVGSLISILAGGFLTDFLGRRTTLLVSLFGSGVLAMAMGLAPGAKAFVPLLLVFGFVAELYRPASHAIISDLLPSEDRATGFAALRVAINLGFAVGMAIGGLLVDWSWRVLFTADGVTTILFGATVFFFIRETRPTTAPAEGTAVAEVGGSTGPWRDGVYAQLMLSSVAFSLVVFCFLTILPLTVTLWAGYPAAVYGAIVGFNGLVIAAFEISVIAWLQRFRRLRVAALGIVLSAVGFALTGAIPHWAWFLLTVTLWTGGEILTLPQQMSFIADWAPPDARGRYMALYSATWSVGFALNPILLMPLHARVGERVFWPLLLLVLGPAALIPWRLDRIDRPERLRGRSGPATGDDAVLPALSPEA